MCWQHLCINLESTNLPVREGGVLFVTVNQFINYVAFNPTPHRSGSSM